MFRKSGKSEYPEIRIFGISEISDILFPKIRIFGNPKIWIFRFPGSRKSENPDFRKCENPDLPISGASDVEFSEASDAGHRRCPDPSKKHGDQNAEILLMQIFFAVNVEAMRLPIAADES